jgi:hypothetical protein
MAAITTGNFQDLVQLSADTLYHLGPDFEVGNSVSATTVSHGFVNTAGALVLVGIATGNATVTLPAAGGALLTGVNVSGGTTSNNLSAVVFSNSNNVSFGLNGSTMTASATVASSQGSVNFSGGTTSNNLSAITFSNSNGVSFGLNGSTMTASVAAALTNINVSAGTTSNNLTAVVFSNSNNVSFGLNGSTVTATASVASSLTNINFSAGTTSNLLSAVTFSNSNGISFGLNGSTMTAVFGGVSSWSVAGGPATALSMGNRSLFFEAIVVPYNITVTNLMWLASISNSTSNVSGGVSVSAALYTLNGGTAGSLSLASSGSTSLTWTSGAALSSFTGINYLSMTLASWAVTPGPYLLAFWFSQLNSASMSVYGPNPQPVIGSGRGAAMSTVMLNGLSQATTNALPSSFGITNTASYIRTGATAAQQPFVIMQGT